MSKLSVVPADASHAGIFRTTWVSYYLVKSAFDRAWAYRLFPWESILAHPMYQTFAVIDPSDELEGMIALSKNSPFASSALHVAFLSSAPWNYGEGRRRKGVGTGLVGFAVNRSMGAGFGGAVILSSTPESETFYERLQFDRTGRVDEEGLAIFQLSIDRAKALIEKYAPLS